MVSLPYQLLLQKSSREALGISLKNHIVIIDEAHNLMDVILGMNTIEVSLAQLRLAREQITFYLQKFRNRLKGKNRVYITQLVRLLDSLTAWLDRSRSAKAGTAAQIQATELLTGKGVDQINLYKLMDYLQESKLARKVQGYVVHKAKSDELKKSGTEASDNKAQRATVPVLTHIQSFLITLTNPAAEGRFFFQQGQDEHETKLKYLLLDPSEQFREVVESARAVILAGGTMSPVGGFAMITEYVVETDQYHRWTTICSSSFPTYPSLG